MSPKKKTSPKKRPPASQQPIQYAKRAKNDQAGQDQPKGSFAQKLAILHENGDNQHSSSSNSKIVTNLPTRSHHKIDPKLKWDRPELAQNIKSGGTDKSIAFQLIDIDYNFDKIVGSVVIRLFGVTSTGHSILACVTGYRPYFLSSAPKGFRAEHIQKTINKINSNVKANPQSGVPPEINVVTGIELVQGANFYYYNSGKQMPFLKIFVCSPRVINSCRNGLYLIDQLMEEINGKYEEQKAGDRCHPFESNMDFEVRFMADLDIVGCGWIECPANKYEYIHPNKKLSTCQIELSINVANLLVHDSSLPEWSVVAPLRTLSFDIECMGPLGTFPDASRDPVIQIANMVKLEGQTEPFVRNCFTLGTCEPIVGSDIIECATEQELLSKWADFVRQIDPDILTGYNIQNFDLPYIMDRAKQLKIENRVCYLSRIKGNVCKQRDASLQSKQMGNRINKVCSMDGRIVFDVLQILLRDYKLRSYSLNNVSYYFLGEQKEDVAYNFIPELQNGSARDRRRLALYCMKDAYLPIRLLDKLMLIINYIEMARVTGVPLNFLISRGQQVKILSMLLRKTRRLNYFLPVIETGEGGDEVGYEGATVIEPQCDFYNEPIATLDFASLYPSIMIAHNLCYTTLVNQKNVPKNLKEGEDYIRTPSGDCFVKAKHSKGLLPQVLEELLAARKKAKSDLKKETDPLRQMVLNGRQLALKVSANSVYGFTGASRGKLPCVEVSQSVTSFGRQMIEMTKQEVENYYKFGAVNGLCPEDAKVIYGDTDSVMIKFGVKTVEHAMELGRHAAAEISKRFLPPIHLEFEKIYFPYLLINKKRYAGLYWTRPEKHDKMDCKGLETVRRDNCPLVASVLNACLEKLLVGRDKEGALNYAKAVISDLLCGRVDISMLTITKELTKKGEKYAAKQAHVELAERMRKRDQGSAPRLGDRVPYVIVNKGANVPAYEKAEDPIWVLTNNVPIDTTYYLEHQLAKPLARIFEPILGIKAEQILINGDHTKKKMVTKLKSGLMAGYFAKKSNCLVCRAPMDFEEDKAPATCKNCQPKARKLYMEKIVEIRAAEHRFGRLWTECQNCAGMLKEEVFCSSRDCPIFYMREKVRNDLEELERVYRRFQIQSKELPMFDGVENSTDEN